VAAFVKPLDILLVHDDRNDCSRFEVAVDATDLNIVLQTVSDSEQAIDHLAGRGVYADRLMHPTPDLVVLDMDIRLAGELAFLVWRRGSVAFSSLPVVIFSEFAHSGTMETALAKGASTFLVKPLESDGWEKVVRQIWDLAMERREPGVSVGG
jgi:DNA-binding NtrC family response regulator